MLKKLWIWSLLSVMFVMSLGGCSDRYIVFHPTGPVGVEEKHLIILSTLLISLVVAPVLLLMIYIVYRYRDHPNNDAPYKPDWSDNKYLEMVWWGVPIIIVAFMGFYTAKSVFFLTNPPTKNQTPVTIQVTSLDWKWVFEYPDQNIATVNYVKIPAGKPVQFIMTADSPMNSLWIPKLGGQEYAMPGMAMRLWLQANKTGNYFGTAAHFTGRGFAHMHFRVIANKEANFNKWVHHVKDTAQPMKMSDYRQLQKPGLVGKQTYSSFPKKIFGNTIKKNGGKYINRKNEEKLRREKSGM